MTTKTGVNKASRGVGQQSQTSQRRFTLQARGYVVGQCHALIGGAQHELTGVQHKRLIWRHIHQSRQILLLMGTVMVMVGLLFKVGAAPFHAWTPDVYTGAPTPVTGFMAAAVKLAAFAAMLRFFQVVAAPLQWSLIPIMVVVIILTMLVGTFAGVVQMDVKRMLAYSSIAHVGFILMGVISLLRYSAGHVLFYVLAYAVATIGAFGVITLVRSRDDQDTIGGEVTDLRRWAGLGKTNPALA